MSNEAAKLGDGHTPAVAPTVLDGSIDQDALEACLEQVLVPEPRPGAVVV